MAADIQAALVAFLQSRPQLTPLLGAGQQMRLYPEFAPPEPQRAGVKWPYATYKLLQDNRPLTHSGKAGLGVATVLLEVWGLGEQQGHRQANEVYLALWGTPEAPCLDGYRGLMGDVFVHKAQCQDGSKDSPETVPQGRTKPAAAAALTVSLVYDDL